MADDLLYFRPCKWEKYQGYKKRGPTWIKNHVKLLDNPKYLKITANARAVLHGLWMLTGQLDRPIPWDTRWLGGRLSLDTRIIAKSLPQLVDNGFIELCDETVALFSQTVVQRTESENREQKERESRPRARDRSPAKSSRGGRCPDVELDDEWAKAANQKREKVGLPLLTIGQLRHRWEDFRTYWLSVSGARGLKKDWRMTWLNNCVSPNSEKKFRPHEVKESGGQVTSSRYMT